MDPPLAPSEAPLTDPSAMPSQSTPSLKRQRPPPPPFENDPPSSKKATRKRTTLACEECRVRKRRCDGATPICGGCMKRMSTCVYASEVQAKAWRNSVIQSLRGRLEELEREDGSSSVPQQADGSDTHVVTASESQPPAPCPETPSRVTADPAHHTQLYPTVAAAGRSPASGLEPCSVERLMEPIDQAIARRSGQGVTPAQVSRGTGSYGNSFSPCSCDRILDSTQCSLPLRRHADRLVDLYFSRVHLVYPILHQRTFVNQYEDLWQSAARTQGAQPQSCSLLCRQKSQGKTFPATLNSVFALASLFESSPPEQNTAQAEGFFRQAQTIDLLEILDDEVGIELIQLGLLMGFYLQSTERFSKCWNITGLTIRMAQNIGLQFSFSEAHKKGLLPSSITQAEWEMRVRVWFGCVLLDREISMSFGRPLMIADGGECLRPPEAIDDLFLSDEKGKWNTQPEGVPSVLESYIQTIKLYDILGEVLHREERKIAKSTASRRDTPTENTIDTGSLLRLDSMIMDWRDSLPPYLHYDPFMEGNFQFAEVSRDNRRLELSSQAKRLYTRFLHVRVLILRPALDLLFQSQRTERPMHRRHSREARVQDLMLSDIAAQCVHSADKLVHFLDTQIRSDTFLAWWYNLSYLHTCGSTLLMSQLCTFTNNAVAGDSPISAWELCLQCISRYTKLSSIARKSFHLLQDSAKRLHAMGWFGKDQRASDGANATARQEQLPRSSDMADDTNQPNISMDTMPDGFFPQGSKGPAIVDQLQGGGDLDGAPSDTFPGDLWVDEAEMNSYWSFTPFLSQLESLPPNFDPAHMDG